MTIAALPVTTAIALPFGNLSPSRGLRSSNNRFPGPHAPGFMLTPASQAKKDNAEPVSQVPATFISHGLLL